MARKKKTRKKASPDEVSGGAVDESTTPDEDGGGKKSAAKKKSKKKKKRARKKAAKKGESKEKGPEPPEDPGPALDVELGTDLDDDTPPDVASLVAEVVVLDEVESSAPKAAVVMDPDEDEPPFEDLDAVLDDDLDGTEDLDELIAATVASADPEDHVEEPSVETLDDDLPVEILDEGWEEGPPPEPDAAIASAASDGENGLPAEQEVPPDEVPTSDDRDEPVVWSEEDAAGTVGLGPLSSPEVRDKLLAQTLAHAEQQEARYRIPFSDPRRAGRWKGSVAALLLLLAGVFAVAPPSWVRPEPPAQVDDARRVLGIRTVLLLQAQQVDAYRVRQQRLPNSLEELDDQLPGVHFVRSGNRAYQLIAYEADGNAIVYDSSDPAPEFEQMVPSWVAGTAP